ncbi:hypothetical protein ACJRO7_015669 [Eucalyptus globulus]|uniref:Uncharacterized protein n=1 Tax=Eucalyptus globulus TaxID=34317 RepID=A0ABD3L878_EUCGL
MASINFIASPNDVSHPIKASSKSFDHLENGFSLGNKNLGGIDRNHVAGASVRQNRREGELVVEGEIPLWLNGIYLRNGPGMTHVGDYNFHHLFDGYAMVAKLQFEKGRLTAGHCQIESEADKAAMKHSKLIYPESSEAPKADNFLFYIGELTSLISWLGDGRVICLTDMRKGTIRIDLTTLETLGRLEYADSAGGPLQSAHPIVTETEFLTALPDLIDPGSWVECRGGPTACRVPSFVVTEHYVVPEMPLRCGVKSILKAKPNPLYRFVWHKESTGFAHVMCKASGKIATCVEVPLFVAVHLISAYEETDEDERAVAAIADCCEHQGGATILHNLTLQNLHSFAGQDMGIHIPHGKLKTALDLSEHGRGIDFSKISPAFPGKRYRFVYACGAQCPCNSPSALIKVSAGRSSGEQAKNWHEDGAVPLEPFFSARPGATEEDDGGYALLLDGSTFREISRGAKFLCSLPYGFHGCWVPKK